MIFQLGKFGIDTFLDIVNLLDVSLRKFGRTLHSLNIKCYIHTRLITLTIVD
jgi:hypothetical protein